MSCRRLLPALLVAICIGSGLPGFGMAGIDLTGTTGSLRDVFDDYVPFNPTFRAGVSVSRHFAVGAGLSLQGAFRKEHDPFLNTPQFTFGPSALGHIERPGCTIYAGAGAGFTYWYATYTGWQLSAFAGCVLLPQLSASPAVEVGYRHDEQSYGTLWTGVGNSFSLGVRVARFR